MTAPLMPGAESTAAALRRVEAERDEALRQVETLRTSYDWLDKVAERLRESGDCARGTLAQVEKAAGRDLNAPDQGIVDRVADLRCGRTEATQRALELAAELATARAELDAVRATRDNLDRQLTWIVARDGGRNCERCEQEVRRGEAYELEPGTGGLIQHIHCPDPSTDQGAPTV